MGASHIPGGLTQRLRGLNCCLRCRRAARLGREVLRQVDRDVLRGPAAAVVASVRVDVAALARKAQDLGPVLADPVGGVRIDRASDVTDPLTGASFVGPTDLASLR